MKLEEVQIFLASPSDVAEEREVARQVIDELNKRLARERGLTLRLIRFEDDAVPGLGTDVQAVVNEWLRNDYSILIGVFWTRFGTPTKRAPSGTVEEIRNAIEKYRQDPSSTRVMLYFKEELVDPFKVDLEQLKQVQEFRESLSKIDDDLAALYSTFKSTDDFERLLRLHLTGQVIEYGRSWAVKARTGAEMTIEPETDDNDAARRSEDTAEEGLLDLLELAQDEFERTNTALENMTDAMATLGERITATSKEIDDETAKDKPSIKRYRRLISVAANDMQSMVKRVQTELPIQKESFNSGLEAYRRMLLLFGSDFADTETSNGIAAKVLESLSQMLDAMQGAVPSLKGFRISVEQVPRLTKEWNKARQDVVNVLDEVVNTFEQEIALVQGLLEMFEVQKERDQALGKEPE
ncbi:MAG: hypothetical protein GX579_02385 [Chloroflexi bacterium]|nr:hypothetical protein [Chloroflexota bacterium]